jgi:hypothetical protein
MQNEPTEQGFEQVDIQRNTRWQNPTKDTLKIELLLKANTRESKMTVVTFGPGEIKELDAMFDRSLQQLDDAGVVVGGLAPQLINLSGGKRELAVALDPVALAKKKAEETRQKALAATRLAVQAADVLAEEAHDTEEAKIAAVKHTEESKVVADNVAAQLDAMTRSEPKTEQKHQPQNPNQRR